MSSRWLIVIMSPSCRHFETISVGETDRCSASSPAEMNSGTLMTLGASSPSSPSSRSPRRRRRRVRVLSICAMVRRTLASTSFWSTFAFFFFFERRRRPRTSPSAFATLGGRGGAFLGPRSRLGLRRALPRTVLDGLRPGGRVRRGHFLLAVLFLPGRQFLLLEPHVDVEDHLLVHDAHVALDRVVQVTKHLDERVTRNVVLLGYFVDSL